MLHMPLLRLQSSEDEFTMSGEIEPVCEALRRRRRCTFTEVAHLVPSGPCAGPSRQERPFRAPTALSRQIGVAQKYTMIYYNIL